MNMPTRQVRRAYGRQVEKMQRSKAKVAHRRARQQDRVQRIRDREAREVQSTAGYRLPYLPARTAVGRLRRFINEDGKRVRLV
jgi:hypothetical protein